MYLSEIWRAALTLKKQFAGEAANTASERADRCFDRGDLDGFRNWNRVTHAIQEIDRDPTPN